MNKRIISIFLALLFILSVSGCGAGNTPAGTSGSPEFTEGAPESSDPGTSATDSATESVTESVTETTAPDRFSPPTRWTLRRLLSGSSPPPVRQALSFPRLCRRL